MRVRTDLTPTHSAVCRLNCMYPHRNLHIYTLSRQEKKKQFACFKKTQPVYCIEKHLAVFVIDRNKISSGPPQCTSAWHGSKPDPSERLTLEESYPVCDGYKVVRQYIYLSFLHYQKQNTGVSTFNTRVNSSTHTSNSNGEQSILFRSYILFSSLQHC